jgi:hypothetical protein
MKLHYLYDQHGSGRERFVYLCSNCDCILHVRRDLGPAHETINSLGGKCLGCGYTLEGNIECRLTAVPDEWSEVYLTVPRAVQRRGAVFLSASLFPHFSLGFPQLDSMLQPLAPGITVVVSGAEAPMVAELAAFKAQLPFEVGGLDSIILFIDGGNCSDPYLFSSFTQQRGLMPEAAMKRVATCRVFTIYQLTDLISEHLVSATADYAARFVVVSDLLGTFNEPELEEREARRLLSAIEEAIRLVRKNALVLVTLVSPSRYDDMVASWADTVVRLESVEGQMRAELLKHPSKPLTISSFKLSQLLRFAKETH